MPEIPLPFQVGWILPLLWLSKWREWPWRVIGFFLLLVFLAYALPALARMDWSYQWFITRWRYAYPASVGFGAFMGIMTAERLPWTRLKAIRFAFSVAILGWVLILNTKATRDIENQLQAESSECARSAAAFPQTMGTFLSDLDRSNFVYFVPTSTVGDRNYYCDEATVSTLLQIYFPGETRVLVTPDITPSVQSYYAYFNGEIFLVSNDSEPEHRIGFEDGWDEDTSSYRTTVFPEIEATLSGKGEAHTGEHSLHVITSGNAPQATDIRFSIDMADGAPEGPVAVSAWVRGSESNTSWCRVRLIVLNEDEAVSACARENSVDWTRLQVVSRLPPGSETLRIYLRNGIRGSRTEVWWDDLEVRPATRWESSAG